MNYTPEQLREWAQRESDRGNVAFAVQLRAHAALLADAPDVAEMAAILTGGFAISHEGRKQIADALLSQAARIKALEAELAAAKAEVARQISANGHWHTRIEQEKALRVQAEAERDALREALEEINLMACYASEEDTDSREAMLLKIGESARAAIDAARAK